MGNRLDNGLGAANNVTRGKHAGDIGHAVFVNDEETTEGGCNLSLLGEGACRALTDCENNGVSLDIVARKHIFFINNSVFALGNVNVNRNKAVIGNTKNRNEMPAINAILKGLGILNLCSGNVLFPTVVKEDNLLNTGLADSSSGNVHSNVTCADYGNSLADYGNSLAEVVGLRRLKEVDSKVNVTECLAKEAKSIRLCSTNGIQCFYSGFLKHIPYVDVLVIAFGFVLRAVAGAAVIDAYISNWLLVCAFTLSLFLAFSKRHHELVFHAASRRALAGYRKGLLNTLIFVTAALSVVEYACYTLRSAMGVRFPGLVYSSVFVALGIGRYMMLVYREGGGGRPEKVLLTDRVLWFVLAGYSVSAVLAVAMR